MGNTSIQSFNLEFCQYLEYYLTQTFANSPDKTIRYFWCDGVLLPDDEQLTVEKVNDKRTITTSALIGTDGQTVYLLTVKLGNYSLKQYLNSSDLKDCLPDENSTDWIKFNIENKTIEITLN